MAEPTAMIPFDQMPYFDEYLREVLRPRAERAIQSVERSLEELIWRKVSKMLAADQPSASDETPAIIRRMLETGLGLRFEVKLGHTYSAAAASQVRVEPQPGAEGAVHTGEVITPRRDGIASVALAQAVLAHPPAGARR